MNRIIHRSIVLLLAGSMILPSAAYATGDDLAVGAGSFLITSEDTEGETAADETQIPEMTEEEQAMLLVAGAAEVVSGQTDDGLTVISSGLATSILGEDEHPSVKSLEARLQANSALYKDLAICRCENYVNIRKEPNAESEILGKIYNDSAAYIQNAVEAGGETWYQVKSGSVNGYIKAEFFAVEDEAIALAKKVGNLVATINTESLRLRATPSIDGETVTLLSSEEKYTVVEEDDEFLKVEVDDVTTGWISRNYVTLKMQFKVAVSIEEEQAELARLARLEQERREAEEQARQERIEASRQASRDASRKASSKAKETTKSKPKETTKAKPKETTKSKPSGDVSSTRKAIAAYAESFVGNLDYVWGGTSLTKGADCSGFVQSIYKQYGVYLPRTSDEQGYEGRKVSLSEAKPGDLVYYGGHIAIYVGDGMIVHASTSKTGVIMSSATYKTPISVRNVLGD